mgnify:CR=1 FL=1
MGKTSEIKIAQLSASGYDQHWNRVDRFTSFVNPLEAMDPSAIDVHGFSDEFCANFDPWAVVGQRFNDFLEGLRTQCGAREICLLAHNGLRFDFRIVVFEHALAGLEWPMDVTCCDTLKVVKTLYPGEPTYSLGRLYESVLGEPLRNAHDAAVDVEAVVRLLLATDAHKETLEKVSGLVHEHSTSLNLIVKRCQKGR